MWPLIFILPPIALFLLLTPLIFPALRQWIRHHFFVHHVLKIPEFNHHGFPNQLFYKANNYVNSLASLQRSHSAALFSSPGEHNAVLLRIEPDHPVRDSFLGATLMWTMSIQDDLSRTFLLRMRRRDRCRVFRPYLAHIASVSDDIEDRCRDLKLYMNVDGGGRERKRHWRSVPFTHPTTLDTIAVDAELKNRLRTDLETFSRSRDYYRRLGRVWRRSYLLYGPSGTGKTSFIAAMANLLCFDVYDIDVSKLADSSELKTLLQSTTSRSIIVMEDLDRYLLDDGKMKQSSLTGLLNYMDGIFTGCCGDGRVMVYTMRGRKEKIDPAILRPGRIDVHVSFPLCDFGSFKMLASSYLGVADHKLFGQVEEMFMAGARLSAAEISELMMVNRQSPKRAIKSVIVALQMSGGGVGMSAAENEVVLAQHSGDLRKLLAKMKSYTKSGPLDVISRLSR
uniref:AAA+ ATPase domain-containing protein n=1 Tax=Kalanchoe fedtschenkoi TaxID=63787 RepID=A0A7N0RAS3_KALFE